MPSPTHCPITRSKYVIHVGKATTKKNHYDNHNSIIRKALCKASQFLSNEIFEPQITDLLILLVAVFKCPMIM